MLWLKFSGWFQCRLATDSDPTDEARGVSGYVSAVAGEPDLDRIVRFQNPVAPRSHCPAVGVSVTGVYRDGLRVENDPLIGATVDLLDSPKFEGRNGIIAEAGFEPIVPFHLEIRTGQLAIHRPHADQELAPYSELQASGINSAPGAISEAAGVWDIRAAWAARLARLQADASASTNLDVRAALAKRMETLSNQRLTRFFGARMEYAFALQGAAGVVDPDKLIAGTVDPRNSWPVEFWCGAWDPDALCGFVQGFLGLPIIGTAGASADVALLTDYSLLARLPQSERRA